MTKICIIFLLVAFQIVSSLLGPKTAIEQALEHLKQCKNVVRATYIDLGERLEGLFPPGEPVGEVIEKWHLAKMSLNGGEVGNVQAQKFMEKHPLLIKKLEEYLGFLWRHSQVGDLLYKAYNCPEWMEEAEQITKTRQSQSAEEQKLLEELRQRFDKYRFREGHIAEIHVKAIKIYREEMVKRLQHKARAKLDREVRATSTGF